MNRRAATIDGFEIEPASFRDPSGYVIEKDGRILRIVTDQMAEEFAWLRDQGMIEALTQSARLVPTRDVDAASVGLGADGARHVLEHQRIPFVSYPYEWSFSALRAAALLHLDVHLDLLARGATLIDASAYNVQFCGTRPVFIDVLSVRRYREGQFWNGHRQFCEQFLNPLLLQVTRGVPFNRWYRGSIEGLPIEDLAHLLPLRTMLSWKALVHIVGPAFLQRAARNGQLRPAFASRSRTLPKRALIRLLEGLRRWIERLKPRYTGSAWSDYATSHSYTDDEAAVKRRIVAEFAAACRPRLLVDVGSNTGDYAVVALENGAQTAIALDADPATVDLAFLRADREHLNLLPLVVDAADPSPDHGWRGLERRSLLRRTPADSMLALALVHHLAIARNVPLDEVVGWLTAIAPRGLVEFVPKEDPAVRQMLSLRDDIFDDYSLANFTRALMQHARIVRNTSVSRSGRVIFWFERD